jgi:hypothetical protein
MTPLPPLAGKPVSKDTAASFARPFGVGFFYS